MNTFNLRKHALAGTAIAMVIAPAAGAQDGNVVDHMHVHYDAVLMLQSAVIAGSLEDTRDPAQWLKDHEGLQSSMTGSATYIDAMRAAADAAIQAQNIEAVASATAAMGVACGNCHVANSVSVEFEAVDRPSDKEKTKNHMQRHQWAADRMWEGLIGPSDAAWSRGANLLFESPIRPDSVGGSADPEALKNRSRRVHQLAANATTVSDPTERAKVYAEFLGNCAGCHSEAGKGPRN